MTSYTVHVVCKHDTRQLLLIQGHADTPISLAVYDEHTGTTLMRMTQPTLTEFKRAISIMEAE
jgi:hypothetical protein